MSKKDELRQKVQAMYDHIREAGPVTNWHFVPEEHHDRYRPEYEIVNEQGIFQFIEREYGLSKEQAIRTLSFRTLRSPYRHEESGPGLLMILIADIPTDMPYDDEICKCHESRRVTEPFILGTTSKGDNK